MRSWFVTEPDYIVVGSGVSVRSANVLRRATETTIILEFGGEGAKAPTRLRGANCTTHFEVPDADDAWRKRAIDAGTEVVMALDNQFRGARYSQIRNPSDHLSSIGGPVK